MANRYWVGGTADWDATAGSKWSTTSGGAGGQAVPTSSDDVFFDGNSGAVTVTGGTNSKSLNFTGFTGTFALTTNLTLSGNLTLGSGMTFTGAVYYFSFGTTASITTNGITLPTGIVIGAGATVTLQDDLITTNTNVGITLSAGTFNANNFNVTCSTFTSSNSNVRTLTMGSGTWTITGTGVVWFTATTTNLTLNANTSTIKLTNNSSSVKHFWAVSTFNNFWNATQGTGIVNMITTASFNDFKIDAGRTLTILDSGSITVTTFTAIGTAGNIITLNTDTGTGTFTLSKASGTVTADYLSITNSTATGGATWNATNSTDGGGNTGWNITGLNRYWIGGTGTWDNSATTHWSYTSGGSGGAVVPTTNNPVIFDGSSGGGTVTPNYNMTVVSITMGAFTGTLDFSANNNSPTMANFSVSGAGTRTFNGGSGTFTITDEYFDAFTTTNLTFNANTSTIKFTNASNGNVQFYGGGLTYYNIWLARATSTGFNIISGSNTFNELKDTGSVAHQLKFAIGTTQTIKTWTVSGTAGNLITITSESAATHTLQKTATSPATITSDYTSISYSNALDIYGGTWKATNSTDGGNNSGWDFTLSPPTVTTQAASDITQTTATGNGNVTDGGDDIVTERGIVWATTTLPTTASNKATSAGTTGAFSASITGLTPNVLYYIRAYAINSYGTSYGNEVTLTTPLMVNVSKPSSTMTNQAKP